MTLSDLYSVQAASAPTHAAVAPDARDVGAVAQPASGATSPAFSWVAMVGTLVVIRILQEYAE